MSKRILFEFNKDFRTSLVRRRKEFMELMIKAMAGDQESITKLLGFGVKIVTEYDSGTTVSVFQDGERVYKL